MNNGLVGGLLFVARAACLACVGGGVCSVEMNPKQQHFVCAFLGCLLFFLLASNLVTALSLYTVLA